MSHQYAKTEFGPPPPNYVAGLARGAVGFITRSDIGPANYVQFDQWSGYQENIFNGEKYDDEDRQADEVFKSVDDYMNQRRHKRKEKKEKIETKKIMENNPSVAYQFADLKRDLGKITEDEWMKIPEAQDYSIKKKKQEKYVPVPDHIIDSARKEQQIQNSIEIQSQLNLNLNDIGKANQTVLTAKLDKSIDSVSGISTVDKSGYLTSLNQQIVNSEADIGDFKRARKLMKNVVNVDPKNANGWIGAARIEELDGKIQQARNILYQGLKQCERSDDLWLEIARLETPEKARSILAQAAQILPKSLKIWLAAADREVLKENKIKVLRKALEHIPDQPKLWKYLIQLENEKEAKILLYKAVECIPGDLDMWLALAKLETYENAKAVLNRARKALPQEHSIWINAAKLEESDGKPQSKITELLQKAIDLYKRRGYIINREDWLDEAAYCEKSGNPLTCVAIIRAVIGDGIEQSERERVFTEEAQSMIQRTCINTARAIYEYGIDVLFPENLTIIQKTIDFEKNIGKSKDNLNKQLQSATQQHPFYEFFWTQRIKFHWKNFNIREIIDEAEKNLPENSQILILSLKNYKQNNQLEQARLVAQKAKNVGTCEAYIAAIKLEYQLGSLQKSFQDAQVAISLFPTDEKLFILLAKIAYKFKSIDAARQIFEKGIRFNPLSTTLIIRYVELEMNHRFFPRARPILEKSRVKLPKCPELWCIAVELETQAENKKGARYMLARGLKECPDYSQLWSYAIELEPKATRKKKIVEALDKCRQDPYVNISVAKLFWKERKMEKARKWIQKSLLERPDIVDSWATLYLFEKDDDEKSGKAEEAFLKIKNGEEKKQGRLYMKVKKSDEGWKMSFDEIFQKILEIIQKEMLNIE
ncbi:pre-mRNA splicing factor, putative [Ichthyophthirius multifiliis]|uniref:Pre-mRNA splicing factor, putative n=1 Tax=Ichthyophthirius multifiliis TaxID=5932 RepID=G0QUE5_ICHMU|nr:pre-mRNA splicing factor, putative [Ichthyophthirius multifiliis]EGR31141.1 pre-mRNA splicing factor, putative [Ichthyophthirius multifiliis]|eukprot:XP_004034627.1 pre-mRNA splicing factor, putative [Ichthyophthirius multifiliis]